MKKKSAILLAIMTLLLCGCGGKSESEYPAYFQDIAKEFESSWTDEYYNGGVNVMDSFWTAQGAQTDGYADKVFTNYKDANEPSFDLSEYLTEAEEWCWTTAGIFHEENEDRTYIFLVDFNFIYDEGVVQNPQVLFLDYATADPADYQIQPYTVEPETALSWVDQCYRIGDNIYVSSQNELGVINIDTKEFRLCREELEVLRAYAQESVYFYRAVYEQDGVTVYAAGLSEGMDVSSTGMVFVAYKDGAPVGYMRVDYGVEKFADAVEVEVVE